MQLGAACIPVLVQLPAGYAQSTKHCMQCMFRAGGLLRIIFIIPSSRHALADLFVNGSTSSLGWSDENTSAYSLGGCACGTAACCQCVSRTTGTRGELRKVSSTVYVPILAKVYVYHMVRLRGTVNVQRQQNEATKLVGLRRTSLLRLPSK